MEQKCVPPPEMESELDKCGKEHKELLKKLEGWKSVEREHQNKINDDIKELEKITNKQRLLLKKVFYSFL